MDTVLCQQVTAVVSSSHVLLQEINIFSQLLEIDFVVEVNESQLNKYQVNCWFKARWNRVLTFYTRSTKRNKVAVFYLISVQLAPMWQSVCEREFFFFSFSCLRLFYNFSKLKLRWFVEKLSRWRGSPSQPSHKVDHFDRANSARDCSDCLALTELTGWARQSVYNMEKSWLG